MVLKKNKDVWAFMDFDLYLTNLTYLSLKYITKFSCCIFPIFHIDDNFTKPTRPLTLNFSLNYFFLFTNNLYTKHLHITTSLLFENLLQYVEV